MVISQIKDLLKQYNREQIVFNEKNNHCTINSIRRDVPKEEVIKNLLDPENLMLAKKRKAKFADERRYDLYFQTSKNRTIVLPVVMKPKSIYVLTIIKKWRQWERVMKK